MKESESNVGRGGVIEQRSRTFSSPYLKKVMAWIASRSIRESPYAGGTLTYILLQP